MSVEDQIMSFGEVLAIWLENLVSIVLPVTDSVGHTLSVVFAPFYEFNSWLAGVLDLPPTSSIYFVIMFASICVAIVYRFLVLLRLPNPLRHLYNFFFGLLQCGLMFRWAALHTVFQVFLAYGLLRLFGRKHALWTCRFTIVFFMMYQSLCYLLELYWHYTEWTASYLIPVMILTMKVSSVPFNVLDGYRIEQEKEQVKEGERSKIPRAFHQRAIFEMPSLSQYLGYSLFYGTITTGPTFEYREYVESMEQTREAREEDSVLHDFVFPVVKRVLMNVVLFLIHFGATTLLEFDPEEVFLQRNLVPRLEGWERWGEVGLGMMPSVISGFLGRAVGMIVLMMCGVVVFRLKYYFVWHFAEAISLVAGLPIQNCSIWEFETSTSIRNMTLHWNKNASLWFRHYVYMRLGWIRSRPAQLLLTNLVSAIWHGWYPGYFWFFGGLTLYILLANEIFNKVRPRLIGDAKTKSSIKTKVFMIVVCQLLWSYNQLSFMLLLNGEIVGWFSMNWYWGHIFAAVLYLFLSRLSRVDKPKTQ